MRALLYISEAKVRDQSKWFSSDFASISKALKSPNREAKISGFLTYYDGCFMQYIEGEKSELSQLSSKIFSDPRHNHIKILLDRSIDSRSFGDFRSRLIGDLKKDEKFARFLNRFDGDFMIQSKSDEEFANAFGIPTNTLSMCG